ncbi:hypothetical protein SNE40_007836 [Patella caerulea]|uniref:Cyclin-H n=1 Tax=Patella caerulea TaxID=87958 RepID=A0AAN8PUA0_PATCE
MFASSTHLKFWTFSGENEIKQLRAETSEKYLAKHASGLSEDERAQEFLTQSEERQLVRHFEYVLKEFCGKFQPPMPKCVVGTSLAFFKRFYVHNSVMDYHPRDIMLTCMYLSCKVEEFYVPIGQFVKNLKGDREKFADIILGFELLLMQKIHYHLTIHNSFRALEGLLIDLKTRYKDHCDAEKLRKIAEEFIDQSLGTDASLIFSPSQIALSALLASSSKEGINLDNYVTGTLLLGSSEDDLQKTIYQVKRIRYMIKNQEPLQRELIQIIQKKLEKCRNQENNPESEIYKRKMEEMIDEDDEIRTQKRAKLNEGRETDHELFGPLNPI